METPLEWEIVERWCRNPFKQRSILTIKNIIWYIECGKVLRVCYLSHWQQKSRGGWLAMFYLRRVQVGGKILLALASVFVLLEE